MKKNKTLIAAILVFAIDIALQNGKPDMLTVLFIGIFLIMIILEMFMCRSRLISITKSLKEASNSLHELKEVQNYRM